MESVFELNIQKVRKYLYRLITVPILVKITQAILSRLVKKNNEIRTGLAREKEMESDWSE